MSGLWNGVRSFLVAIVGLLITVISVLRYWVAYDLIADWVRQIPLVGPAILDWVELLSFPGDKYLLPALGIFLVEWAIALGLKKSWARIVGIALNTLAIVFLIALAILIIPFFDTPFVAEYRMWMIVVWFGLLCMFGYRVYSLAGRRETELMFAAKYVGKPVVHTCDRCGSRLDQRGRCPKCEGAPRTIQQRRPPRKGSRSPLATETREKPQPSGPTFEGEQSRSKPPSRLLARLVGNEGEIYEMRKSHITIGRATSNDIVLNEVTVSARHAEISYQQGQFVVRDLDSTNGTFVNAAKVDRSRLESGSRLQLGRVEFMFEIDRSE